MKPDTHTVQQLFERDVRYLVPLYQRPYVWDESHQWEPLWADISAMLEHQEGGGSAGLWSHFLGAIVLDQEQTPPGEIPRFTVIDGQQRLTTLQILLAAAARTLADAGATNDAELLRELTMNNPRKAEGSKRLKVWPTNANRASFSAVLSSDGPPSGHVNDPNNLIDEAFAYFGERVAGYLAGSERAAAAGSRSELLRITLCDLLKVVSITLEADDNAQVIFETLNARGTPLLALDLVKNAVFAQLSREGADTDAIYEQIWKPQLDQSYWREQRRQGRLNRPVGELFLMHWLTMRLARVIPATELFATFRQRLLTEESNPHELVEELCSDAATMRSFDAPAAGTPEASFFARLDVLDAGTVLPIVLLLFRTPEIDDVRRRRALRILESWLVRRALMRLTTRNYNQFVPRLIAKMRDGIDCADDALLEALAGGAGEISRWPADDEFRQFITDRAIYGTVSQSRIAMALSAVEASLYTNKTDIPDIPSGLSIEHLIPRDWRAHWPVEDDPHQSDAGVSDEAAETRDACLDRLGNLTIVAHPLNSSLSNSAWTTKRTALNEHSKLLLNARLSERESWDEEAVEKRGAWLADRLIEIWPGPDRQ